MSYHPTLGTIKSNCMISDSIHVDPNQVSFKDNQSLMNAMENADVVGQLTQKSINQQAT